MFIEHDEENRIFDYIIENSTPLDPLLKSIVRASATKLINGQMISGELQGRFLKMICRLTNPQNILEIGTFAGFSALCLAEGSKENARIHTIEINDELEEFISSYFEKSDYGHKISLHIGDANDIIDKFEDEFFDLVFLDGDKRLYWEHFEKVMPKTAKDGLIIADNTLWSGKILDSKTKNNDYQTKGIKDFNRRICEDDRVESLILPLRDGISLIWKK